MLIKSVAGFRELGVDEIIAVSGGDHGPPIIVPGTPPGPGGLSALALQSLFGMGEAAAIQMMIDLQNMTEEAPAVDGTEGGNQIIVNGSVGDSLNDPGMSNFREFWLPFALGQNVNPFSFIYFNIGQGVIVVDPSTGAAAIYSKTGLDSPNNYAFETPVHNVTIGNSESSSTTIGGGFPLGVSASFTALNGQTISFTIGPKPD
jgi:hypothetical protein